MITKPRGTYDVLPNETDDWNRLENAIKKVCKLYNYKEIRTPIFEAGEVFHRDQNDSTDMVTKETYDFKDRADRMLTLRPEGTAGCARAVIENKLYADNPLLKLFYMGPMFRYENPQKGRTRQFSQFGIEAYGSTSPLLDAEVISTAVTVFKALGLKGIKVKLNSIGDEQSRKKYREVLVDYFSNYKDQLCHDCLARLEKNPLRILDCKVDRDLDFFKNAPKVKDYLNEDSINHFNKVVEALDKMGIAYEIDYNLVRGLDYYSHTVFEFEVDVPEFGAQNIIGGGGRYDNLINDLGGPDIKGVGLACGMERLLMAIDYTKHEVAKKDFIHLFLIALGEKAQTEGMSILNVCRMGGLSCEMDFLGKGLKGQFKMADKNNSLFTAVLGDNELANKNINVKDNLTEEQITINIHELYPFIVNRLKERLGSKCSTCQEKKDIKDE